MPVPTNKQEFREYCLRALGHPILKIEVTEEQMDDRIEEALRIFYDYAFDGSKKIYYKHVVTAQDKTNGYVVLPEYINGVVSIFDMGFSNTSTNNLFSLQYQIVQQDAYTLLSQSLVPYYMTFTHLALIDELLVGKKPIRFNRHENKVHIDMDWSTILEGTFLIFDAYAIMDPEEYADVWNDRWLKEYSIALIKRQWGSNLSKFQGIQMAGGVTFNGAEIYSQAETDITRLRDELSRNAPILHDMIG